jgi:hypothetical protein
MTCPSSTPGCGNVLGMRVMHMADYAMPEVRIYVCSKCLRDRPDPKLLEDLVQVIEGAGLIEQLEAKGK